MIACFVFGQQYQMVAAAVFLAPLVETAGRRHIYFASDDGFEGVTCFFANRGSVIEKFLDAEHIAMVGNGHRIHAVGYGFVNQRGYLRRTIEGGVLRMNVQVCEMNHIEDKILKMNNRVFKIETTNL